MRYILRPPPVLTGEGHRPTLFEIFFDLVFVFALTRVVSFMGRPPTPLTLTQGLILLLLLWMPWLTYAWLGNQARVDLGLIRVGTLVAMAAIFVAALVIPDAWRRGNGSVDAPLTLALAYIVFRALHLALYFYAGQNQRLRRTVRLFAITTTLAWIPLILGAVLGGTAQTPLWAAAFTIDWIGGLIASVASGWQLRSPSHFTERHGLVVIIALGESLASVGAGTGAAVTRVPVLVAGLLAFTTAACMWLLYFENAASAAGEALATEPRGQRRSQIAVNTYSAAHFPLIAGVIYFALGIEQVLDHLAHNQPGHAAGTPLDWTSTVALYGGVILYLAGRALFLRLSVGSAPRAQFVEVGVALLLLPVGRILPALTSLGLITAFLVALVCYEQWSRGTRTPATSAATVA
jgi:low temperature requirement protein LtrA